MSTNQFPSVDFQGNIIMVTADQIRWRPATYGLVLNAAALLLVRLGDGRFVLPGGGIDKGERVEDALQREMFEETGIRITIDQFLSFREDLVYFPRNEIAIHTHRFFYACTPLNVDLTNANNIPQAIDHETPHWVPATEMSPNIFLFKSHAEIAFDYLRHHQLAE